jgi:hypothetical protein
VPPTNLTYPPEFRREAIRLVRASDEERAHLSAEGRAAQAQARGEDSAPGERDPKKSLKAFFAREEIGGR